jgi:hypothetical protein
LRLPPTERPFRAQPLRPRPPASAMRPPLTVHERGVLPQTSAFARRGGRVAGQTQTRLYLPIIWVRPMIISTPTGPHVSRSNVALPHCKSRRVCHAPLRPASASAGTWPVRWSARRPRRGAAGRRTTLRRSGRIDCQHGETITRSACRDQDAWDYRTSANPSAKQGHTWAMLRAAGNGLCRAATCRSGIIVDGR